MKKEFETKESGDCYGKLIREIKSQDLIVTYRPDRYQAGDILDYECVGVWPEVPFRAKLVIERFVGGGFAGQVYKCRIESIVGDVSKIYGLSAGKIVAVKILVPPSVGASRFRNFVYMIGFQSPFSAQINRSACRAGLLWQKLAGLVASRHFGMDGVVADVYASFFDPLIGSWGEIREWVEGRQWKLETDVNLRARRFWRTIRPENTGSPEYIAKRQFMFNFVRLLKQMGASELSRQYEWWTMKSQPNVLKRAGHDYSPSAGLCAVDFRAGLALLPFLPMSPADLVLIPRGIFSGSLVQFDRFDYSLLRKFVQARRLELPDCVEMAEALIKYDIEYRRSMPDLFHQGFRLLFDSKLRLDVRIGLSSAYKIIERLEDSFASSLIRSPFKFFLFSLIGFMPVAGRFIRRIWGSGLWRKHYYNALTNSGYFKRCFRANSAACLARWHVSGRIGERKALELLDRPVLFLMQRITIAYLPAFLHLALADPLFVFSKIKNVFRFVVRFYKDGEYRIKWLTEVVDSGYAEGMLDYNDRMSIINQIRNPYIARYLQSVAVHFATLPVTQLVSAVVGSVFAIWIWISAPPAERNLSYALAAFGTVVVAFQLIPISPGSICRGGYVVYLMIRDRNWRDYVVAAPLSFVKYIGYLAFPLQMAASFPVLSRFMASRWARDTVNLIPVFGERGALLEHMVFDAFYNFPRSLGIWARSRMSKILDIWLLIGLILLIGIFIQNRISLFSPVGINLILAVVVLFLLPRLVFYPVLAKKKKQLKDDLNRSNR